MGAFFYLTIQSVSELELVLFLRGPGGDVLSTWMWIEWYGNSFRFASVIAVIIILVNITMYSFMRIVSRKGKETAIVTQ